MEQYYPNQLVVLFSLKDPGCSPAAHATFAPIIAIILSLAFLYRFPAAALLCLALFLPLGGAVLDDQVVAVNDLCLAIQPPSCRLWSCNATAATICNQQDNMSRLTSLVG